MSHPVARPTRFHLKLLSASLALSAFSLSAHATLSTTQSFDVGATTIGATSALAQAAFLAAVNGQVNVDFEAAVTGFTFTPSVTSTATIVNNTSSAVISGSNLCSVATCGFNTTVGGSNFLLLTNDHTTTSSVTLTFSTAISYFGAYVSGLQLSGSTITFNDGQSESISLLYGADSKGGLDFVGFSDPGKKITSITFNTSNDIVALDDVIFGTTAAAVPEPATWALMGLGLVGLAFTKAKHQAKKGL